MADRLDTINAEPLIAQSALVEHVDDLGRETGGAVRRVQTGSKERPADMAPERLSRTGQPPAARIVDVDPGDDRLLCVAHGIPCVAGVR